MTDVAGQRANRNGKWLEANIADLLLRAGYYELEDYERKTLERTDGDIQRFSGQWFAQQVSIDKNMYGAMHRTDIFVHHPDKYPIGLHIEAKYQGSGGSVDEKYVFTALSLAAFRAPSILVLDGEGARSCAVKWLKQYAKESKGTLVFMSLADFSAYARDHL